MKKLRQLFGDSTGRFANRNALRQIFVRRAYDHAIDTLICRRCDHRSREGVICLEFHNRPNHDASCQEDLFEQRELRQDQGQYRPLSYSLAISRFGKTR